MVAPLKVCTKGKQRAVIRFLWSEGASEATIHQKLSAQYGGTVSYRNGVSANGIKNSKVNDRKKPDFVVPFLVQTSNEAATIYVQQKQDKRID